MTGLGWYCPTCDTAHTGSCPAWTPPSPERGPFARLARMIRLIARPR